MASVCMASPATAQSANRLVVVVAEPHDPRAAQEIHTLQQDGAALRERDVLVQTITPDAARRDRPALGVGPQTSFAVLLVGKDGGVKMRADRPVTAADITALIDTMPMRREEMKRQVQK